MNDGGENLLARKAAERHVLPNLRADTRKSLGECDDVFVLRALAHLAESWMIAILLSALGIPTSGLNVPISKWADPDVGPGRRNRQRLDPSQNARLRQLGPINSGVGEALPGFSAADAGARVINVPQAGRLGGVLGIEDRLHVNSFSPTRHSSTVEE